MHVYMYEYMVHTHCGLFWEGCDRDEGQDGFLTGGGVLMGRRADVTVFVNCCLKIFNNFKFGIIWL